ncbi:52 kDa repressor of the inhibitor of the protein kinase-like isoform X1 [Oratosquilla oratoria]|uniref:52 kDa repressor of the inhibitor of the protein kinase-like isoform X1 n=2 Tax=Oratosquilla oratoria TaxID=337810 RepID=UPI003F75EC4F
MKSMLNVSMAALVNKSHACIICMKRKETDPDLIFHRFPKDQEQCFKWKIAINVIQINGKTPEQLNRSYRVCSRHFSRKNYLDAKSNRLCHNGCPDQNLEGSNCSTPAIPDCSHIGTTAQFRDKESEDVRAIISSVPHETIQSFHDEPNPQHPASGADSNGQHVPPFELHEKSKWYIWD